jgi:hypothetical protein
MPQRYRMPGGCDPELWSLVKPMRVQIQERGLSQAQLAIRLGPTWSRTPASTAPRCA